MSAPAPDPRGYYRLLGLTPDADAAAVKAAYRRRAKDLHPDRNPGAAARDAFQHLSDAYRVLSSPLKRRDYDNGRATDPVVTQSIKPAACVCCGRVAAQPRHVVFPVVRGRLFASRRGEDSGIYCRDCADRTALKAAFGNWLLGWWSLPLGPWHTIGALVVLAGGGAMPKDRNFALLTTQAQAFLHRHEADLARGLARQALTFATNDADRRLAEGLAQAAGSGGRALRDRWAGWSWQRVTQALLPVPPLAIIAMLIGGFLMPGPAPRPDLTDIIGLERPMLLRTGQLYEVTARRLPVRTGPGASYHELTRLEIGTVVLVSENAPGGSWVRILTADGVNGFVSGRYLTPGLPNRTLGGALTTRPQSFPE